MTSADPRTLPDFEDDAERAFQCSEAQREDAFWDALRMRTGVGSDTQEGQAVAARHRFTWHEALALRELSGAPSWWGKGGWLTWLSVYAAVALQWPDDEAKQGVAAGALLSSSVIRAFTSLETAGDREVNEDHPRCVLLMRHPGVEELEHSFAYVSRVDSVNSEVDLRRMTTRQVAQAHRVDAAGFGRWLEAIAMRPSAHIAAWLAAAGVDSRIAEAAAPSVPTPMTATMHKIDDGMRGVLAQSTARQVVKFSAAELRDALKQENIQKIRLCHLLPKLIFRIAHDSGFFDFEAESCPLEKTVLLTWLEQHCHELTMRKGGGNGASDPDWMWYLGGLPSTDELANGTVSPTLVNNGTFRELRRESWGQAQTGVRRVR